MTTMNVSLPDSLRRFVEDEVSRRGFSSSSEYLRELIRREQERIHLREEILAGAQSVQEGPFDGGFFDELRRRVAPNSR
jgi:antitoxin ParD1/3/4